MQAELSANKARVVECSTEDPRNKKRIGKVLKWYRRDPKQPREGERVAAVLKARHPQLPLLSALFYDAELTSSTTLSASAMSLSYGMWFDDESPSGDSPLAGGDGAVGSPPAVQGSTATCAGAVGSSVRVLDCTSLRTFGLVL